MSLRNAWIATLAGAIFLLLARPAPPAAAQQRQLFSLSAQAALDRGFPSPDLSYLLLDASGNLLARRWPEERAVPPGSLVKPFVAVAYGEQYGGRFPIVRCMGTRSHCWYPPGHGRLGLEEAITQSCNAYFIALAKGLDRRRAAETFARYGLAGPEPQASAENLAGLGGAWKETPAALARAYLELDKEQQFPVQARIVKGMLASAQRGTGQGVDAALGRNAALAKTGTAVCTHRPRAAADGFAVVLYPAAQPRLLLLVRVHGVTGAKSADVAGAMLRALGAGAR